MTFLDQDGDIKSFETKINSDAYDKRLQRHDEAIYKNANCVDSYRDDSGNASGKSIQRRYQPLQDDCASMGVQFEASINEMAWFIAVDLSERNREKLKDFDVSVIWNMDMTADETEIIENINKSSDLSLRTRLENHPWVDNVDEEMNRKQEEVIYQNQNDDVYAGHSDNGNQE